jgi:GNAT superfamily N-acetyltransferase
VIRTVTLADAAPVAHVVALCEPQLLFTERYFEHLFASTPPGARAGRWCSLERGELVGYAGALKAHWSNVEGEATFGISVHPDARGRGHGSALYERVESHLLAIGARRVTASSHVDAASRGFAERRGFTAIGERRVNGVDPRTVGEPPPPPDGTELLPLAAFADDPRPIWRIEVEASRDIPTEAPIAADALSFADWHAQMWSDPELDRELSVVAVVDGEAVTSTTVFSDRPGRRMVTGLTGTLTSHRGRGLARLAKHHSLYRAGQLGIELALTQNHDANGPMLAVNDRLGYVPVEPRLEWEKRLP